jgi:amidase
MFKGLDALVCPVTPRIAYRSDTFAETFLGDLTQSLSFAVPFNLSGNPSVTFPCGLRASGIPIGVQLVGAHLSETRLLTAVHAFQQASDWHLIRPPLV